jgi:hypothetical protein
MMWSLAAMASAYTRRTDASVGSGRRLQEGPVIKGNTMSTVTIAEAQARMPALIHGLCLEDFKEYMP